MYSNLAKEYTYNFMRNWVNYIRIFQILIILLGQTDIKATSLDTIIKAKNMSSKWKKGMYKTTVGGEGGGKNPDRMA